MTDVYMNQVIAACDRVVMASADTQRAQRGKPSPWGSQALRRVQAVAARARDLRERLSLDDAAFWSTSAGRIAATVVTSAVPTARDGAGRGTGNATNIGAIDNYDDPTVRSVVSRDTIARVAHAAKRLRLALPPTQVYQLLREFVDSLRVVERHMDYAYDADRSTVRNASAMIRNRAVLRQRGLWTELDEIVASEMRFDIRQLTNFTRLESLCLSGYFDRLTRSTTGSSNATDPSATSATTTQTVAGVEMMDLLFNPRMKLAYLPEELAVVVLRATGLQDLSEFTRSSLQEITDARSRLLLELDELKAQLPRLERLLETYERLREEQEADRSVSYLRLEDLEARLRSLREERDQLAESAEQLRQATKYYGDFERVTTYYIKQEERFLQNLTAILNDTDAWDAFVNEPVRKNLMHEINTDWIPAEARNRSFELLKRPDDDFQDFRYEMTLMLREALRHKMASISSSAAGTRQTAPRSGIGSPASVSSLPTVIYGENPDSPRNLDSPRTPQPTSPLTSSTDYETTPTRTTTTASDESPMNVSPDRIALAGPSIARRRLY